MLLCPNIFWTEVTGTPTVIMQQAKVWRNWWQVTQISAWRQYFEITLANGGLEIELNADYALPDDVKTAADAAIDGIVDGSVTIFP